MLAAQTVPARARAEGRPSARPELVQGRLGTSAQISNRSPNFFLLAPGSWLLAPFSHRSWLLATLYLLPACSPTYVLRAGYEEAKILWHRRPIAEILQRPDLDTTTRAKLEMVLRVRHFAEQELAFNVGGSYSSVSEIAKPPIVYVVTAAQRTKLEAYTWWFPIIGRVAYKGYFEENQAKAEMLRLQAEGYDTYLRAAVAFSTLGWFADPLLPQLLRYNEETLANIIIHELFHSTFYLSGQTALNESLANFAGHRGAIAFFAQEQGDDAALTRQAQATWESELAISQFVAEAVERLKALYDSPVSDEDKLRRREELFTRLQEEFRTLPGPVRQNANFASVTLNNAVILHYLLYLQELALFEQIYQHSGQDLHETLARIIVAVQQEKKDPFSGVRALADSHLSRVNEGNLVIPFEVVSVEGEQVRDAVSLHNGDETGVVGLFAFDVVSSDQRPPVCQDVR